VDKCKNIKMKYVLSIDQGTTSSRAIVFDENQKIIANVPELMDMVITILSI